VSTGIDFINSYSCPHCRAELETRFDSRQGWLRCPACGFASLPPEPVGFRASRPSGARAKVADEILVISDSSDRPMGGDSLGPSVAGRLSHATPARLVFRTGLLVSLALAFIAFLDHRTTTMTIFGCLAIAFFFLLLRHASSRGAAS
jgi:hypothetical protein